jgi:hypothetical protein
MTYRNYKNKNKNKNRVDFEERWASIVGFI